jgi:transposase
MDRDALERLSKDDLIALLLAREAAHAAQIAALEKRIAELEARLGPPKTPDNSSLPPAQGPKPNRAERRAAKRRQGRPGTFRKLADQPGC